MRFRANPKTEVRYHNGAIGFGPGGPIDCLGPFAKVKNCPIHGTDLRATAYATGYADTWFSIPAYTRVRGKYIGGYFTFEDYQTNEGWDRVVVFRPYDRFKEGLTK